MPDTTVNVCYFASLRESLGDRETVPWQPGLTLGSLRAQLAARGGAHAQALAAGRALRGAVDRRMAAPEDAVPAGAEVAFFPPVTGG